DDAANQLVYGEGTTPRMVFEGRAARPPSDAVTQFRDALEEANALARDRRAGGGSTASARAQPAHTTASATAPAQGAQTQPLAPTVDNEPRPAPFEDVPTTVEPLPPEPAPAKPGR
ncbi:MAG TPA: ligand-binding protein SH3, partial [Lysobacter sp.]|nr:ligand-binding protein SH3 [Lysobacter sp.]